uniref:Chromo domain-containing protein n=1 Tax=Panagrolaimus sp. ES5 TaxID=591445 RepID=A0AC34FLP8_9BILA
MAPKKRKVQYEVEKILDVRGHLSKKEYLIKWKGYKSSSNSWEPAAGVDCPDLIKEFFSRRNGKSTPKSSPRRKNVSPVEEPSTHESPAPESPASDRPSPRRSQRNATPSNLPSNVKTEPTQNPSSKYNGFTPACEIEDLKFVVKAVKGLHASNGEN